MLDLAPGTLTVVPRKRELDLKSIAEAGEILGKSRPTIYRWLEAGYVTRHRIYDPKSGKRKTAVDMNEVRHFLEHPPRIQD
jgi:transposase